MLLLRRGWEALLGVTEPEDRAQCITQVYLRTLALPSLERERVKASGGTIPKILIFNIGCSLHSAPPSMGSFATGISSCPMCVCNAKSLQLYQTLCDTMDCSPPSSCPWDSPGKNTGVGCHALLQGIFLIQGLNPRLLHLLH